MSRKSFVTTMPDKAGAFLKASRLIAGRGGNIVRVSYNKAVDQHMLFIDVEASEDGLLDIEKALSDIGYINEKITETRVIEVSVKIPDRPGAVIPVLEIFSRHHINISYMNSFATGGQYQNFKFGLLIEDPRIVKTLLDGISAVYPVNVIECESSEENLDNTVFYIRLANEMQGLLDIGAEQTMSFISESNRILQVLQSSGENAGKVFNYIRRFAHMVSSFRGERFAADVQKRRVSARVMLYSIQPYCGSNVYILASPDGLCLIDTGYAIYSGELLRIIKDLFPDWATRPKKAYISHADVDHCGMLAFLNDTDIIVNRKSAENFARQLAGLPDYREQTELHLGYSKISQIISGYRPPDLNKLQVMDEGTPEKHEALLPIGTMTAGDLEFTVLEGSGGHMYGEMIYVCRKAGVVFTGDNLVNISGFSKERAEFNALAPYLMKSVNVNSEKATEMRRQVTALISEIAEQNKKPCLVCGGHGPLSQMEGGELSAISGAAEGV